MEKYTSPEQTLTEIRHLMERSSRFMSLSGLSGVLAGIYALIGAAAAYYYINQHQGQGGEDVNALVANRNLFLFLLGDAVIVVVLAVGTGIFLTTRKAEKDGSSLLDSAARRLIINLSIPLVSGGVFCAGLLYHGYALFIVPTMLIFYGLALLHASKYTRDDVRSLGMAEILLGFISMFVAGYALVFWALGFGVLHIAYGTYMYFKYEK